eukprot:gene5757-6665_t
MRIGYDIKNSKTYYTLLDEEYLSKSEHWVRVDARTAQVKDTWSEALEACRVAAQDNGVLPPLMLTSRTLEFNSNATYLKRWKDEPTDTDELRMVSAQGLVRNAVSGFQLMTDKFVLARLLYASPYVVPSLLITHGKITDALRMEVPTTLDIETSHIWYRKDPLKNKSEGIELFKTVQEAVDQCPKESRYIVQREIVPMLLRGAYKFDVRAMVLMVFTPAYTKLYLFHDAIVRSTSQPYSRGSVDRAQQITNFCFQHGLDETFDNIYPLADVDTSGRLYNSIDAAVKQVFGTFIHKINQLGHHGSTLLGLDFIFDESENCYLLEINYSPSMFQSSNSRVASICRRAVGAIGTLALEPIFFGTEPHGQGWTLQLEHSRTSSPNVSATDDDNDDINLFD